MSLRRFIEAQEGVYPIALTELRSGRKTRHWIWFVFPQLLGLGRSEMSRRYALTGPAEARAYLADPLLGARLHESTRAMLSHRGVPAAEILGRPDDRKFHACVTLFRHVSAPESEDDFLFSDALDTFFDGRDHPATVARL
ncbi:DUF1810 domain-containing protein [Paroceanicella profunda]|uniref:DUF1810 domain-containing protein n=1 Tax=Paroceanicella profunda TaxID=2579971 RepID=A0A5B8FWB8_9RHOB|nr:DUF1810 domain-containing protein [Paroceanicella profunda]QDL91794.1 DUF1810 domain-containing protein [Paroceanicella profunda]